MAGEAARRIRPLATQGLPAKARRLSQPSNSNQKHKTNLQQTQEFLKKLRELGLGWASVRLSLASIDDRAVS